MIKELLGYFSVHILGGFTGILESGELFCHRLDLQTHIKQF